MAEVFTNLASTTLSGDHTAAATSLVVADGSVFPSPSGSDFFRIVAFKKSTAQKEIMTCASRSSNTLTVTRAQEGTSALALIDGDIIEMRPTAAFFTSLAQKGDIQDGGPVYAAATGTDTIAATFDPAVSAAQDGMVLRIVPANTITGAATFNPGSGAAAIKKDAGASDVAAGDIVAGQLTLLGYYNSLWHLIAPAPPSATIIPSATVMLFMQASAPTGWTKSTSHDNKSLRIVSGTGGGSGGATAFTTVFGSSKTTGSHTLSTAELPSHSHGAGTLAAASDGAHTHTYTRADPSAGAGGGDGGGTTSTQNTSSNGAHTHTISGSTAAAGSGDGHTHTLSLDLQYVDLIAAERD